MPNTLRFLRRLKGLSAASSNRISFYPRVNWYWKVILVAGLCGIGFSISWVAYDMGRKSAGFDRWEARSTVAELRRDLVDLRGRNLELSRDIVNLQGKLKMALSVEDNISEKMKVLASENDRIREELIFFETLMTSGQQALGVSVPRFEVDQLQTVGEFEYRILVVQSQQRVKEFNGFFELVTYFQRPNGSNDDILVSAGPFANKLRFKFYQRATGRFRLPEGSKLVNVEIRIFKKGDESPVVTKNVEF